MTQAQPPPITWHPTEPADTEMFRFAQWLTDTRGVDLGPLRDENGEVVSSERVLSHNKILLYTFSEEFYKYVVAQELKDENADFFAGIAPSNFCYTNIRNGFGAFAGVSRQETDWITPEFIEKNR